jgi:UDP-arabinose 4-epimerase
VPLALQAALGIGPPLEVYGTDYPTPDGTAIRDYIHVADLAAAHLLALEHLLKGRGSAALNLGTGQGHSVREVIAAVETVVGRGVPRREVARRPGDPATLVADPASAADRLGWRARTSDLKTIIESAFAWHASQSR